MIEKTAQFCCTYGRGTGEFVIQELKERMQVSEIQDVNGKIVFRIDDIKKWKAIFDLKTVERIFYVYFHSKSEESRIIQETGETVGSLDWINLFRGYYNLRYEENETPAKKMKMDNTYRISVKLRPKHLIKFRDRIQNKAREAIANATDMVYSPHSFQDEISIQTSGGNIFVGIPLTRQPLSQRQYLKHIGLRSTISYVIGKTVKVFPGQGEGSYSIYCIPATILALQGTLPFGEMNDVFVLDPMCGFATIICEAAQLHPSCHFIGVDKNWDSIIKARDNAELGNHIDIVCADASRLPFRQNFIDTICCDLPFGLKHCSGENLKNQYSHWLRSWRMFLKGSSLSLLTSDMLRIHLESILPEIFARVVHVDKCYMKLGNTYSWMVTVSGEDP